MESKTISGFLVSGISLSPDANETDAFDIAATDLKRAGIDPARIRFHVYKRSVDARKKKDVRLVYTVAASLPKPIVRAVPLGGKHPISSWEEQVPEVCLGTEVMQYPPLVVGMGPAGLFTALFLAEHGYCPTIIDRGDAVQERIRTHKTFLKHGLLDPESNIQFGAGGAGTFSDGKLMTRIHDPNISYVLNRFVEFGAPKEILTEAKPHIGTDLLVGIVERLLVEIERLGGRVLYRCRMDGVQTNSDGSFTVQTTKGDFFASSVILAPGHSSRDTYDMLLKKGYAVETKPFSVGVRIEHLQEDIDKALYGSFAGHPKLGKGEYHLSDTSSGRGVYTFCMCPGGEVVAATSEEHGVVVNGMSPYARDGKNANSAVAVTVRPNDFDGTPQGAIAFQRQLEQAAFRAGGGDYCAPIQTVGDFLDGRRGSEPKRILPTYGGGRVRLASMNEILPPFVGAELKRGLLSFDQKLPGFAVSDAVLSGVETRTSAPIRILRGETLCAIGRPGIYPCGEGAGYAGGITSAAADGLRVAMAVMKRFAPIEEKNQ